MDHQEFQARWREGTLDPRPRVNASSSVRLTHLDATQRAVLELYKMLFVFPLLMMAGSSDDTGSRWLRLGFALYFAAWFAWRSMRLKQDLILDHAAAHREFFERMCGSVIIEFRPQKVSGAVPPAADSSST